MVRQPRDIGPTFYLDLGDVLAIAGEVLCLDTRTIIRLARLDQTDSAVARPKASYQGEEFYPDREAKAASLLYGIARNHSFVDGNKRVAILASVHFLNMNGLDIDMSPPDEVYDMIVHVASGSTDVDVLTDWIRTRTSTL